MLLSLFGVSLGFGLAYVVGDWPLEKLGLPAATPQGAAVAKASEALPMCAAIFLATFLARRNLADPEPAKGPPLAQLDS